MSSIIQVVVVPEKNQERDEEIHTMLEMLSLSSKIREDSCPGASVSSDVETSSSLYDDENTNTDNISPLHYYTRIEISCHNTEASAWIVAGDDIYDVTDYVEHHPGGKSSLMKKIGGTVDCTKDFMFHSKSGQNHWKQYLIGKITKSPSKNGHIVEKEWWKFW
ncbi:cytochrome b5 [Fragilariopsis cylindrus CCMP1102]|uniref:Cytochrome b5 n=1 Tax=Fragilariopsis cylindrus CCMP1102 TaxID=635003 RepID=A0A1E7EKS5_9STRA|nr:cytochrome b5 [Fragilariopsis cylindrus CCMP1102]|eukprot:OEU06512.1 cytochrome b5 [Fragilariopsis cylindrus CCMP1102]